MYDVRIAQLGISNLRCTLSTLKLKQKKRHTIIIYAKPNINHGKKEIYGRFYRLYI
jgi:hypothetical protein